MADCCSGGTSLIYSCSGQSNVGEIADKVVRKLRDEGFAKMACLAGVGADLAGYVQSAKGADIVYAIDGCSTACAKRVLERVGATPQSVILTELGIEKGTTPASDAVVEKMYVAIRDGSWSPQKERVDKQAGSCSCGGNC